MQRTLFREIAILSMATALLGACDELGTTSGPRVDTGPDTAPSFLHTVVDHTFAVEDVVSLTLPPATGGNGDLHYSLAPIIPGLRFDGDSRELKGKPRAVGAFTLTYRVSDSDSNTADSDVDSLNFTVDCFVRCLPDCAGADLARVNLSGLQSERRRPEKCRPVLSRPDRRQLERC